MNALTKQSYEHSSYKVNGKYVSRAEALQKYRKMYDKDRISRKMGMSTGEPLWHIEESSVDVILHICRRYEKAINEACKKSLAMREQSRAFIRPIAQTSHNSSRHNVRAPRSTSRSAFSRNGGSGDDDGDPDSSDDPDLPRPGARAQLPNSLTSHQNNQNSNTRTNAALAAVGACPGTHAEHSARGGGWHELHKKPRTPDYRMGQTSGASDRRTTIPNHQRQRVGVEEVTLRGCYRLAYSHASVCQSRRQDTLSPQRCPSVGRTARRAGDDIA